MKLKIVQRNKLNSQYVPTDIGNLSLIKGSQLHCGHYLTIKNTIICDSINEFVESKLWRKKWVENNVGSFGGQKEDEVCFNNKDLNSLTILKKTTKIESHSGRYYIFQYQWDHNYHHFLVTSFSRFYYLTQLSQEEKSNLKVVVKKNTPKYQLEFIRSVCKQHEVQIFYSDEEIIYEFEYVYIGGFLNQDISKLVHYYDTFTKTITSTDRNLFLSRRDAPNKRPLANENQLLDLVDKFKFNEVVLSDLTIKEKIDLFSTSKIILSTFGAGNANIIFAKECTHFIFIEHPVYKVLEEYRDICRVRGIKLIVINSRNFFWIFLITYHKLAKYISPQKHEWSNRIPWRVNLRELKNALTKVIN
jgi:capsular polysaccharide biosynthesis protein